MRINIPIRYKTYSAIILDDETGTITYSFWSQHVTDSNLRHGKILFKNMFNGLSVDVGFDIEVIKYLQTNNLELFTKLKNNFLR